MTLTGKHNIISTSLGKDSTADYNYTFKYGQYMVIHPLLMEVRRRILLLY